jgi:hypothetical protein
MDNETFFRVQAARNRREADRFAEHAKRQAMRADSCLDPRVALDYPTAGRPESGPTVAEYYRRKRTPGQFDLHELKKWPKDKERDHD